MASTEYQTLLEKIDHLTEKVDGQFIRLEDGKLSRTEYEHAHEALVLRVASIEQKIESEIKSGDIIHDKLDTASETRYDKLDAKIDTKFQALDLKMDNLKEAMNTRFDALREQSASNRRSWVQWSFGLGVGLLGGGGIGSIIWFLVHMAHP